MKNFDINENASFELEVEINGTVDSSEPPVLLFTILANSLRISSQAERIDNGVYRVTLPAMKKYLDVGEYDFKVEVLLDGKYFVAIEDKVSFKDFKPVVKIKDSSETKKDKKPAISVKVAETEKKETKKEEIKEEDKEKIKEDFVPQINYIKTITV